MALENDFDSETAKDLKFELENYHGHYNEVTKKIEYDDDKEAMKAYCNLQIRQMELHRWLESERVHHDLGKDPEIQWVAQFSEKYRKFWRKTHSPCLKKAVLSQLIV